MAQVDPSHNIDALIIGTGEFHFAEGVTTTPNAQTSWLEFGNIVGFTPEVERTLEEHLGSYRGVRRADKTVATENRLAYTLRSDEWNRLNLQILFGGTATTGHTQLIQSAAAGEAFAFNTTAAVIGKWYNIRTSAGLRLRNLTGVTITALVEGTDFVLDLLMSRIKFLTAQSTSRTPTVTAAAIVAGDAHSYHGITPLNDPIKDGYGKILLFDQHDSNKVVLDHDAFSCQVSLDSAGEVDGTGFGELTMKVLVTTDVGIVYSRWNTINSGLTV
jgi:hypothetical protein